LEIKSITKLGRIPEHGRIRLGVKTERAMKALDTFRFTSPDRQAICQLADLYGGVVGEWSPPRAKQTQWEVISGSAEIRIFLPPNSIDVHYEQWSGGGCQRRCDGEEVEVPMKTPDGMDLDTVPCICAATNKMDCNPYTRLRVIIPDIKFGGIWRMESKGWNAANELPGMATVLEQLQTIGIVEGKLTLEQRSKISGGQTRHFVVPRLSTDTSPTEILSGQAQVHALSKAEVIQPIPELESEVVDAVIVEDEGWDIPPPNTAVKKNPNPPPRFIPA